MKQYYFIAVLVMAFLTSCSSDDDNTPDSTTETNYFPVENGQFWVYDVSGEFPGRDSLYVANDTTINSTSYKKFKTKELAYGFFSSSLAGNGVRKSGDKLLVSGATNINLLEGFPVNLAVSDFVIFKESAADNEQLGSISGTLNYQYENIPLTFNYTMKSVFKESLASFNVPNYGTYQDVKVVRIIINLNVTGVTSFQGMDFPFNLINEQEVLISTQYYAKNVGMIYSNTEIKYELATQDIPLPIPSSGSQNIKEYLDDYTSAPAN